MIDLAKKATLVHDDIRAALKFAGELVQQEQHHPFPVEVRFLVDVLPSKRLILHFLRWPTIAEVEKLALDLPETERAILAAHLLGSLPSVLHDEDEGLREALRRDAEFGADPSFGMSLEELDQKIERRRN
jgi:hypothetical protein